VSIPLAVIEDIIDASGVAPAIQALLPSSARRRQLTARTLLTGMLLALADCRPAHLTEGRNALIALPEADQVRLGVIADWNTGPHQLTYRQAEHTARLIARALGKDEPDGAPSAVLQTVCDSLLEASIPAAHKNASSALAADWTDVETWSRPPRRGSTECADPEASWGHRNSNLPGPKGEMFFGYFLSAAVMAAEEDGPAMPELARRMTLTSCHLDPARALAPVLTAMPAAGIPLGDIINDSGYAHRDATAWAIPLRRAGAQLVQDLHPHDRGPQGTHHGAVIANGNLYCPATPKPLLELAPLPPGAAPDTVARHDQQAAELARHKLSRLTADRRRIPPRHLPRHRRQDPLPAPPTIDDPPPGPARDPHPAAAPAPQLRAADHHRATSRRGQDTPETRLPLGPVAALLPAAHQRRTGQRHHQRHRHQQHRPRLVQAHRPDRHHAVDRLPARHPQPAHPHRLPGPPGRQRTPRRRGPATPQPQTAPHQPRPARRRAITTRHRQRHRGTQQPQQARPPAQPARAHTH
jgi:hypothetical protein